MIDLETMVELIFSGLLRGGIYTLMAVGQSIIFGVLNVVNFAQGELYMLGAYITYFTITILNVNPIIAFILSTAGLFAAGCIMEKSVIHPLRSRGGEWLINSFVLTLGVSVFLKNIALGVFGPDYRGIHFFFEGNLKFWGVSFSKDRLMIFLTSIFVTVIFWIFIKKTRLGRAIRAVAQNEEAARIVGVNINKIYLITFGLGAMLSGLAGGLLLPILLAYPTVGITPQLKGFAVVMLGGLGNIKGAIIGGFLLGIIESFSTFFFSAGWQNVIALFIVVFALLVKPTGLFGAD